MKHVPVLLKEVIEGLSIKSGDTVLDATVGLGGHSGEICRLYGKDVEIVGLDLDREALAAAQKNLSGCKAVFKNENFRNLDKALADLGISKVDRILADLGVSSYELDLSERGFTFQKDEPLSMNLKSEPGVEDLTAAEILNDWQEENIAQIIYGYGEERYSRRIAQKIAEFRKDKPIRTTFELVEIIRQAVPKFYLKQKTHFATRTFQALRIAVNDELRSLEEFLGKAVEFLRPGGRLAVITFHSLEDRIVKRFFRERAKEGRAKIITKKPIIPGAEEVALNRRARSAKLRILEKNEK